MLIHLDLMFYVLKNYMDTIIWAELCVAGKKWVVIENNRLANTTLNRFQAHELCGL